MNIVAGVLILVIGFGIHWIAQLVSVVNWDFGVRVGFQETNMPPEYKVYEHAIAVADSLLGWIYGLAGVGILMDADWGYKLAWFPGVVFVYHGLSYWFWTRNRRRAGHPLTSDSMRIGWFLANVTTGLLAIWLAWNVS